MTHNAYQSGRLDLPFVGHCTFAKSPVCTDWNAIDADVIKTYVELGLGVAILPSIAYEPGRDRRLAAIDASHLFEPTITHIAIRRDSYLRDYLYDFISMIAPEWDSSAIDRAVKIRSAEAAAS